MLDFNSPLGQVIERRLCQEQVIWLTTVDARLTPQPRPVWFHWDSETVLILSQPAAAKVRHISRNPRVALNFNTDAEGGQVGVLIGEARLVAEPLDPGRMEAYVAKYVQGIRDLEMTPESMLAEYQTVLLVTPLEMRGF
jgi:PPOX class probable F420-dependent enzyme